MPRAWPSARRWRYIAPPLLFLAVALLFSWSTLPDLADAYTGYQSDVRHNVWFMWHIREATFLREPLYYSHLLYYPQGISLLTHGHGPLIGLLGLPFWAFGPIVAHNITLLLCLALSGYSAYLLARALPLSFGVALFVGVALMTAAMPLAGLVSHFDKILVAPMVFLLLAAYRAVAPERSARWVMATALCMLLVLLNSGYQFVLSALALMVLSGGKLLRAPRQQRLPVARRLLFVALLTLIVTAPLLYAIRQAAQNPAIQVDFQAQSAVSKPDLIEFLLPSPHSYWLGAWSQQQLRSRQLTWSVDSEVSLGWPLILLMLAALATGRGRRWGLFAALFILFSLGPTLQVAGRSLWTRFDLPIPLPYALLAFVPGLDFMRFPGRFMLLGFVLVALTAGIGLETIRKRIGSQSLVLPALLILLLLGLRWPQPWPQEWPRPMPNFYTTLAQSQERYGVFDLPIRPNPTTWDVQYASIYQLYQLTHRKGISGGYISRPYQTNPVLPCFYGTMSEQPGLMVNGVESDCMDNARFDLRSAGYRYVVFHKPQAGDVEYPIGSPGEEAGRAVIQRLFGGAAPVVDDAFTTVYALPHGNDTATVVPALVAGVGWQPWEAAGRWASSPAELRLYLPTAQNGQLEITPLALHDPLSEDGVGRQGTLTVRLNDDPAISVPVEVDRTTTVGLALQAGINSLELSLQNGNFRPSDFGSSDDRWLSFAIRAINLRLTER
ncbi:MAG: hypothetical protein H6637_06460 [Ardenticatenales bacterium]|nr:hypothetical protein [Ardenticatenales bacterium]